jgi:RHS repeat-associated protein
MNPGTWLMGGGAGGGGAGGGNGDGEDGAGGAPGENGGEDGEGNGNGAGSCGEGGAGGCTNCGAQTAAGDPIDVVTGEVFSGWKTDLFLPGFFHLDLRRKYSSKLRKRDVGLGFGWVHALAWELHEETSSLVLYTGEGTRVVFPPIPEEGTSLAANGWAILRIEDGYVVRPGSEFFHVFSVDAGDDHVFRLIAIRYRNRGHLVLSYDRGRLASVRDTVGRTIHFERGPDDRIARLLVPQPQGAALVAARYAYSDAGDLVQVTDADGFVTRHQYDDDHRLLQTTHPTGLTFHFRYDERGRGVETWGDFGGATDPALADDVPAFLADGSTPARGIYHVRLTFFDDGTSEVVDSVRFQRYLGSATEPGTIQKAVDARGAVTSRVLDELGREIAHEDPLGAIWSWDYDDNGQVIRETDPEGHTTRLTRDDEGRVLQLLDAAGGTITYGRDDAGEIVWATDARGATSYQTIDPHGQLSAWTDRTGATRKLVHDAMGNLVEDVSPTGAITRYRYDYFGRRIERTAPSGATDHFRYSLAGKLIEQRDPEGRVFRQEFDGLGHIVALSMPDGTTLRVLRGGNGWPAIGRYPNGDELSWRYNREGWLTTLRNEKGEVYRFEHDADGHVVREIDFAGNPTDFVRDLRGRVQAQVDRDRGKSTITRNLLGQVTAIETANGEAYTYRYNARNELIGAAGPANEVTFVRDPNGNVIQETHVFDGATYVVDAIVNPNDERVATKTSLGDSVSQRRDDEGALTEMWVGNDLALRIERDALGYPHRFVLPAGGAIVETRDAVERLAERRVQTAAAGQKVSTGAPAWVGEEGVAEVGRHYRYTTNDELLAVESTHDGVTEYAYDLRHHVRSRARDGLVEEGFAVDEAGNYLPRGPGAQDRNRQIAPGNRLVRQGTFAFVFDVRGFLRERRSTETGDVTTYEWNDRDLLAKVYLPDGTEVSFAYDLWARRLRKTVVRVDAADGVTPVKTVHYVWDLAALRHEVHFSADGSRRVRTYLYDDHSEAMPIGHRDDDGPFRYYVRDLTGAPEEVIDAAGEVVGTLRRTTFGRVIARTGETTEVRSAGQIEDPETGLFYNRYRTYDPDLGRYISPDPLGLNGGENLYAYGPNPIGWVDPLGLHVVKVISATGGLAGMVGNEYESGYADLKKGDPLRNQASAHSERKMNRAMEGKSAGESMTVEGQFPPCPTCHKAMMKSSKGMKSLKYQWKTTDADGVETTHSMTYPEGKGSPGNGEALASAYELNAKGEFAKPGAQATYSGQADEIDPSRVAQREKDREARAKRKAKGDGNPSPKKKQKK